jgi:hypothetical protein
MTRMGDSKQEEASIPALKQAVERMHGCPATYHRSERVRETFEGKPVWEGDVAVFGIIGHPTANVCYAWSSPVEGSDRRRFFAVLHEGPVKSARDAVRASIVQTYREATEGGM